MSGECKYCGKGTFTKEEDLDKDGKGVCDKCMLKLEILYGRLEGELF